MVGKNLLALSPTYNTSEYTTFKYFNILESELKTTKRRRKHERSQQVCTLLFQAGSLSLEMEWKNAIILGKKILFIICAHTYKIIK